MSQKQHDRVLGPIELGERGEGSSAAEPRPGFERGSWVQPTVFAEVANTARIASEEIFEPVVAVMAFEDERDAVWPAKELPEAWPRHSGPTT